MIKKKEAFILYIRFQYVTFNCLILLIEVSYEILVIRIKWRKLGFFQKKKVKGL